MNFALIAKKFIPQLRMIRVAKRSATDKTKAEIVTLPRYSPNRNPQRRFIPVLHHQTGDPSRTCQSRKVKVHIHGCIAYAIHDAISGRGNVMDPQVSVHADQMISMGEYRFPHNPKCRSDPDMESRVVLIGEPGVGKTSLVQRLLRGEATENYQATVGAVFHKRDVQVDGRTVSLHIWDTAGQEKYRALGPIYYRKSLAAIAVCDQTKPETLQNLKPWIDAFRETADGHFVVIAANKEDLESDNKLDMEQIVAWAKEHQAECVSTSAQTGSGVEDLFEMVARHVVGKTSADVTLLREATTEKTSWC